MAMNTTDEREASDIEELLPWTPRERSDMATHSGLKLR